MKLNTDNPNTMPVTDAVYGPRPKGPGKPERPRKERTIFDALTPEDIARLSPPKRKRKR